MNLNMVALRIRGSKCSVPRWLPMRAGGSEAALAELAASGANTAAGTMMWPGP